MRNRTRIWAALAAAVLTAGLLGTAPAQADHEGGHLPTCSAITDLNCTSTVTNVIRGGHYCQQLDGSGVRCELYWPHRNPTANAHGALRDPDAFPSDYLPSKARAERLDARVDRLWRWLDRKDARIQRLRDRLDRR